MKGPLSTTMPSPRCVNCGAALDPEATRDLLRRISVGWRPASGFRKARVTAGYARPRAERVTCGDCLMEHGLRPYGTLRVEAVFWGLGVVLTALAIGAIFTIAPLPPAAAEAQTGRDIFAAADVEAARLTAFLWRLPLVLLAAGAGLWLARRLSWRVIGVVAAPRAGRALHPGEIDASERRGRAAPMGNASTAGMRGTGKGTIR